jgi:hypothetical protein
MNRLIDLERYPLHRLDSEAGKKLVAQCIADLDRKGMFTLEGFMRVEVIDAILPMLLERIAQESFTATRLPTSYGRYTCGPG